MQHYIAHILYRCKELVSSFLKHRKNSHCLLQTFQLSPACSLPKKINLGECNTFLLDQVDLMKRSGQDQKEGREKSHHIYTTNLVFPPSECVGPNGNPLQPSLCIPGFQELHFSRVVFSSEQHSGISHTVFFVDPFKVLTLLFYV